MVDHQLDNHIDNHMVKGDIHDIGRHTILPYVTPCTSYQQIYQGNNPVSLLT